MKHKYPATFPLLCIVFLHITFLACERRELTYYETAEVTLTADWSQSDWTVKKRISVPPPCFIRKQAANRKYSFWATVRETGYVCRKAYTMSFSLIVPSTTSATLHSVEKSVMKH